MNLIILVDSHFERWKNLPIFPNLLYLDFHFDGTSLNSLLFPNLRFLKLLSAKINPEGVFSSRIC